MPLAITFDYWNTLYAGVSDPTRLARRRRAMGRLLADLGAAVADAELEALYAESGREAERWWRDEQRGYTTADRVRWILARVGIERPEGCEHVARACAVVDEVLLELPPALLPGAADTVRALAARHPLGIVSDTGFASGRAQDRLLARDGILEAFGARVYSMDVGHAKPRPEPFAAAVRALGVPAARVIHIGDDERTDVGGALAAGMRAIRVDFVARRGASDAEFVARSYEELMEYLEGIEEG
jgi:putative hydrolase of the HAD superfamily